MRHSHSSLLLRTASAALLLLWLAGCGNAQSPANAYARPVKVYDMDDSYEISDDENGSFEVASISDPQLSGMRGGFLMAGGLRLNFGLTTNTSINGIIVSNLVLSSNKLDGNLPQNLQQLVQAGTGNNFNTPTPSVASNAVTSKVLTIVQNSMNNATIENKNVLNLSVSHFNSFNLNTAALSSIIPLVRALH